MPHSQQKLTLTLRMVDMAEALALISPQIILEAPVAVDKVMATLVQAEAEPKGPIVTKPKIVQQPVAN